MNKFLQNLSICVFFTIAIYLSACTAPPKKTYLGTASLRIVNAVPERFNLTLFVNDTLKTPTALKFADLSGKQNVNAGTSLIYTKANGNSINRSDLTFLFLPKENYTVFIAGKISNDSISYISFKDSLNIPTQGKAKVRFVNTSYNSSSLDGLFSNRATDSIYNYGNIGFRAGSNYLEFRPGIYYIKVKKTGGKTVLVNKTAIDIKAGKIYTLWAKGLIDGSSNFNLDVGILNDN